mmetsp:Transcript_38167/g.80852  ORF Transcript_38167/g.80852 Transcript_38167/m.80852 type:complete len:130 (-) Transcript_38167:1086-1475(-)
MAAPSLDSGGSLDAAAFRPSCHTAAESAYSTVVGGTSGEHPYPHKYDHNIHYHNNIHYHANTNVHNHKSPVQATSHLQIRRAQPVHPISAFPADMHGRSQTQKHQHQHDSTNCFPPCIVRPSLLRLGRI